MTPFCRVVTGLFAAAWAMALAILAIGTYGLFGVGRDPLAGVFLIPLGLPWNMMFEAVPETLLPWIAILAPAVNLAIIALLCMAFSRRRARLGLPAN